MHPIPVSLSLRALLRYDGARGANVKTIGGGDDVFETVFSGDVLTF